MSENLVLLDTTFRDGTQGPYKCTNLRKALAAIEAIDRLGVAYHEVGFAFANKAAQERIGAAMGLELKGKVAAFGRTHPKDVAAILDLKVPVGVLVGKSRFKDTETVIHYGGPQNLALVRDSVSKLVEAGVEVIFDAEHFFQAVLEDDADYAVSVILTALEAGACWVVLCDTNGKVGPTKVEEVLHRVLHYVDVAKLGVHFHDDRGRAVANSEKAWELGIRHHQGTLTGCGERTGNTALATLIPNLVREYDAVGVSPEQLANLRSAYIRVCYAINQPPALQAQWVGERAFATDAGMHASGLERDPWNYLHDDPAVVGNQAHIGLSEDSGRANIRARVAELGIEIPEHRLVEVAAKHDQLTSRGANFGLAEASFELFVLRTLGIKLPAPFVYQSFNASTLHSAEGVSRASGQVVLRFDGETRMFVADGHGPLNALDKALRQGLEQCCPQALAVRLVDYSRTAIDTGQEGTAAHVRSVLWFTDGVKIWATTAVDENGEVADWKALLDGYIYKLYKNGEVEGEPTAAAEKTD